MTIRESDGPMAAQSEALQLTGVEQAHRLTGADRFVIERFLDFAENSRVVYSQRLLDLLQGKLLAADTVDGIVPDDLAIFGRRVSCILDDATIESGVLSFGLVSRAGEISLHSLLGATLIGMTAGQAGLLAGEDGSCQRLVLQSVSLKRGSVATSEILF